MTSQRLSRHAPRTLPLVLYRKWAAVTSASRRAHARTTGARVAIGTSKFRSAAVLSEWSRQFLSVESSSLCCDSSPLNFVNGCNVSYMGPLGRVQRTAAWALQYQYAAVRSCRSTATSDDCKARLIWFRPCKTRYIRIPGFTFFSFGRLPVAFRDSWFGKISLVQCVC